MCVCVCTLGFRLSTLPRSISSVFHLPLMETVCAEGGKGKHNRLERSVLQSGMYHQNAPQTLPRVPHPPSTSASFILSPEQTPLCVCCFVSITLSFLLPLPPPQRDAEKRKSRLDFFVGGPLFSGLPTFFAPFELGSG